MIKEYGIDCKGKEYQKIDIGKANDLSNQTIGRLNILWRVKILNHDYGKQVFWLCQCECGNIVAVSSNHLNINNKNKTYSCGCLQKEAAREIGLSSRNDLTGKIVNGIRFIKFNSTYKEEHSIKSKNAYWDCECHCGKIFTVNSGEILQNRITSCGCLRNNKSNGETVIEKILQEKNINYVYDIPFFRDLKLPSGALGRYDFVLLDKNNNPYRIIEFDGIQHYKINSIFYKDNKENFNKLKINDEIKNKYALQHNIPLVRIPYTQLNKITWEVIMGDKFLISE